MPLSHLLSLVYISFWRYAGRYLLDSRLLRGAAGLLLTEGVGLEKDGRVEFLCTRCVLCTLGDLCGFAVEDSGRTDERFTVVRVELRLL